MSGLMTGGGGSRSGMLVGQAVGGQAGVIGADASSNGGTAALRHQVDPLGTFLPDPQQINPVNLPSAPTVPQNTAQSDADKAMQAMRIQSNGGRASTTLTASAGTLSDQDKAASRALLE